jgi:hypothetical protein
MTLARVLYAAHGAVVAALGLLVVFGRSRQFHVALILFLFGFLLSATIAVLTAGRRNGFRLRTTLLFFVVASVVAVGSLIGQGAWTETRWPGNRDCLKGLAVVVSKEFENIEGHNFVVLDAYGKLRAAHPRSAEFAPQILRCGLSEVWITSEQIEFFRDDLLASHGYVFRDRGAPQLPQCPYLMAGVDNQPGRILEERWYYCA